VCFPFFLFLFLFCFVILIHIRVCTSFLTPIFSNSSFTIINICVYIKLLLLLLVHFFFLQSNLYLKSCNKNKNREIYANITNTITLRSKRIKCWNFWAPVILCFLKIFFSYHPPSSPPQYYSSLIMIWEEKKRNDFFSNFFNQALIVPAPQKQQQIKENTKCVSSILKNTKFCWLLNEAIKVDGWVVGGSKYLSQIL